VKLEGKVFFFFVGQSCQHAFNIYIYIFKGVSRQLIVGRFSNASQRMKRSVSSA